MRTNAALLGLLMLAAVPQDGGGGGGRVVQNNGDDSTVKTKKEKTCCKAGVPNPWPLYNKGVEWTTPIDAAVEKAADKRKILMVVHFVGRMDREGC